MREIWIPEFLVALFLFLPLIRPFFKGLKAHDGLAWLPLPAFVIALVLFPAYGFRPELLPLFIYAAVFAGICVFRIAGGGAKFENSRRMRIVFALPPLVLLILAAWLAFYFFPLSDTAPSTQGVYSFKLDTQDQVSGETQYSIRVYTDENDSRPSRRPLIVILPPVLGSCQAVDQVSCELRDRGFTVLTYSRRGFDSWPGPGRLRAFSSGTISAAANRKGHALENGRTEDLGFLLPWIRTNPLLGGNGRLFDFASRDAVFLAGYDAGGSALILSGLNDTIPGDTIRIRGLVAIESPLWSVYREETLEPANPPRDAGGFGGWLKSIGYGLGRWFLEMKPKKISGTGQVPRLSTPILFLVSDRSRDGKYQNGSYRALFKTLESARAGAPGAGKTYAALASADGAGPLDYSDFPVRYPLISALFPGLGKPAGAKDKAPGLSAGIITWFAAMVMKAQGLDPSPLGEASLPPGVECK